MTTDLLFLHNMSLLTCQAAIQDILEENGKTAIILNQTVFYPQGGGQPYDEGKITHETTVFHVQEVRFVDGIVKHIGQFESGSLNTGDQVTCQVNADRRHVMSRLHSAGHVVDMAVSQCNLDWIPGKGFHFPDGPYVEYAGQLPEDVEATRLGIEQAAHKIISQGLATRIEFMPKEEMHKYCRHVPDYLSEGKPARVVFYGDYAVPCGGTHLANLADIGPLQIRKVKMDKGSIRVSYSIQIDS